MLKKQPPTYGGNNRVNSQAPKPPSKYLWGMELGFILLSVLVVVAFSAVLYMSATNSKKAKDASTTLKNDTSIASKSDDTALIAKNEPSVVRIASTYCSDFDLKLNGVVQNFTGGCSASYGSGFLVSPEGYVATNGHVVKASVGEILLTSIELGNLPIIKNYLDFLVKTKLITQSTANDYYAKAVVGDRDALSAISSSLSDSSLAGTEVKENKVDSVYAVQLSNEAVAFDIKNLKKFSFDQNIVEARLIDVNYDPYADVSKNGFGGSDVAILKLGSGSNYPFNNLGSLNDISQGSKLTVLGFPGSAENELVDTSQSSPTATQGTVSSIRAANGSKNKLIQTDVSIAKGNSGGPAYDANGNVVGLATYKVSDGSDGSANINYMRDIQDLKDLLNKNDIKVPAVSSGNQRLWEQGLNEFAKAYYSYAIADFKKLKEQYPQNRLVDSFIVKAEDAKSNGKEATDPRLYLLIIAGSILFIFVPALAMFFVVSHHHRRRDRHEEYIKSQTPKNNLPQKPIPTSSQKLVRQDLPIRRSVDMLNHAEEPPKK